MQYNLKEVLIVFATTRVVVGHDIYLLRTVRNSQIMWIDRYTGDTHA